MPDLYIEYLVVRPLSPIQGQAAQVAVLVTNGGGESGPFRVRWLSGEPEESGCLMDFPSIAGGGGREESCEYTYRGRGYFITWAIVDEDGEVEESDETNNSLDLRIQVLHP